MAVKLNKRILAGALLLIVCSAAGVTALMTDRVSFSNSIHMTALQPVTYVSIGSDITAAAGTEVVLTANASGGSEPYAYQWYRNGEPVGNQTDAAYAFIVSEADGGSSYFCRVSNPAGFIDSNQVTLTLAVPLSVAVADISAATGSSPLMTAEVSGGTGPYSYRWYEKSVESGAFSEIPGSVSESYAPQTGTTGMVTMHEDEAEYMCLVSDSSGGAGSDSGILHVTGATEIQRWNIGASAAGVSFSGANGMATVAAVLYSDGALNVSGNGDTTVFGTAKTGTKPWLAPWLTGTFPQQVLYARIADDVGVTNMTEWYDKCVNLTVLPAVPTSVANLDYTFQSTGIAQADDIVVPSGVTSMTGTFQDCINLTHVPDLPEWVTVLNGTFRGCTALTSVPDIPVCRTNIDNLYRNCTGLTQAPQIMAPVTSLTYTFQGCTALTQAPVIPNTVTTMRATFLGCTALTQAPQIPASVTSIDSTFQGCTALLQAPVIPGSVTSMNSTFLNCSSLAQPCDIPSSVTSMYMAFYGCASLTGSMKISLTTFNTAGNPYSQTFYKAATKAGTSLVVYGSAERNNGTQVQQIVNSKSSDANVIYGGLQ